MNHFQVRDLDFSIRIIGSDVKREKDGLAMSSRNIHLSPDEREKVILIAMNMIYILINPNIVGHLSTFA